MKFRDPTVILQFVASVIGVVVALNVGLSDVQAALWVAAINAVFTAVNAFMVRPVVPALVTGAVGAVASLVAAYGWVASPELVGALNFAVVNALALFFARPNVTPLSDPQPGQGVSPAVASRLKGEAVASAAHRPL